MSPLVLLCVLLLVQCPDYMPGSCSSCALIGSCIYGSGSSSVSDTGSGQDHVFSHV